MLGDCDGGLSVVGFSIIPPLFCFYAIKKNSGHAATKWSSNLRVHAILIVLAVIAQGAGTKPRKPGTSGDKNVGGQFRRTVAFNSRDT
jgi:hypothetical protein